MHCIPACLQLQLSACIYFTFQRHEEDVWILIINRPSMCMLLKFKPLLAAGFKGQVAAAAIRAWTLLLSSLPAWHLTASSVEVSMAALASALHSSEVRPPGVPQGRAAGRRHRCWEGFWV